MRKDLDVRQAPGDGEQRRGILDFVRGLRPRRAHLFRFCQRLGLHVTPVDFSQPIPDTRTLGDELWARRSELPGVDMRDAAQLELLESLAARFRRDYDTFPRTRDAAGNFHLGNRFFGPVDAEVLYSMVRHFAPRRVVEIGSGFSSLVIARALADAAAPGGRPAEFLTVDPHANEAFADQSDLQARAGGSVKCTVVRERAQRIPLAEFEMLGADDILFIDSSHVLAIGSDVQYLFLEVLPRLRKGVVVHVHDIFMPCEYPKHWVLGIHEFWTEQYLLQSFLAFNHAFEVLWAGHYMHTRHPEALERSFASYDRRVVAPGSFWIRRIG